MQKKSIMFKLKREIYRIFSQIKNGFYKAIITGGGGVIALRIYKIKKILKQKDLVEKFSELTNKNIRNALKDFAFCKDYDFKDSMEIDFTESKELASHQQKIKNNYLES